MFKRQCPHQWATTGRQYHPPKYALKKIEGYSQDLIDEVMYGITIHSQECELCGTPQTIKTLGEWQGQT